MAFFFHNLSSDSPRNDRHDYPHTAEHPDHESSKGTSSLVGVSEVQEQPTSSYLDDISRRVQELVQKINDSRISDQKVIDGFQEKLVEKVTDMCEQMKEHMYTVYEENVCEMQVKLQELSQVLDSCTRLSNDLLEASRALASLREGLAISQAPKP